MYEPDFYVGVLLPDGDEVLAYRGVTVSVSEFDVEVAIVAEVNVKYLGTPGPDADMKPDWYRRLQPDSPIPLDTPTLGEATNVPYRMKVVLMTFPLNEDGESGNVIPWTADVAEQFRTSAQTGSGGVILRLSKHWPPARIEPRPVTKGQGFGHGA